MLIICNLRMEACLMSFFILCLVDMPEAFGTNEGGAVFYNASSAGLDI